MNEPVIGGDVGQLAVFQKAKEFSESLAEMCAEIHFSRDKEFLAFLVDQARNIVTSSIEKGWSHSNVAEILLSMYDAQGALAMLAYYLDFLQGEAFLASERAAPIEVSRLQLDELLTNLIEVLRQELELQTRHVLN